MPGTQGTTAGVQTIPKVLGGMGIAIVSTSKGLMTDRECREQKVGGEVIGTCILVITVLYVERNKKGVYFVAFRKNTGCYSCRSAGQGRWPAD